MQLNFSNRDLRDRSFKGQDLSGADFSGSDLRGCDFSEAILVGANFARVQTGQSRRRMRLLIARTGATAIAITLAGAVAGVEAIAATGIVAVAITRAESEIIAAAIAGAAAVAGCSGLISLFQADFLQGLFLEIGAIASFGFAALLFLEAANAVEKSSSTTFASADLSQANFDEATIADTDFSGATLQQVSYQGTTFSSSRLKSHPFPQLTDKPLNRGLPLRLPFYHRQTELH